MPKNEILKYITKIKPHFMVGSFFPINHWKGDIEGKKINSKAMNYYVYKGIIIAEAYSGTCRFAQM